MPIFEYACNRCENRFEKLLRSAEQSVDCPQCESHDLRKLFSSFSSPGGSAQTAAEFCPPGGCSPCQQQGFCGMGGCGN